jgi:cytochrome c556
VAPGSKLDTPHESSNRGKWMIVIAFSSVVMGLLPLSWLTIQAELRQARNMKALSASVKLMEQGVKDNSCATLAAVSRQLSLQIAQIDANFPILAKDQQFQMLRHALEQSSVTLRRNIVTAQVTPQRQNWVAIRASIDSVKTSCANCHEVFRSTK